MIWVRGWSFLLNRKCGHIWGGLGEIGERQALGGRYSGVLFRKLGIYFGEWEKFLGKRQHWERWVGPRGKFGVFERSFVKTRGVFSEAEIHHSYSRGIFSSIPMARVVGNDCNSSVSSSSALSSSKSYLERDNFMSASNKSPMTLPKNTNTLGFLRKSARSSSYKTYRKCWPIGVMRNCSRQSCIPSSRPCRRYPLRLSFKRRISESLEEDSISRVETFCFKDAMSAVAFFSCFSLSWKLSR